MADSYNYIDADKISIFPSSNAVDNGKITSEYNIRNITSKLRLNNYKLSSDNFNLSVTSGNLTISNGVAVIFGYRIEATESYTITDKKPSSNGTYKVVLRLNFISDDINKQVKGDSGTKCHGIDITFKSTSSSISDQELEIGTVDYSGGSFSNPSNINHLQPFSSSSITLTGYNDNTTSISDYLLNIVPELYVSKKTTDTKTGSLTLNNSEGSNTIKLDTGNRMIRVYNSNDVYSSIKYNTIKFTGSNSSIVGTNTLDLYSGSNKYISLSSDGLNILGSNKPISIRESSSISIESSNISIGNSNKIVLSDSDIKFNIGENNTRLSISNTSVGIGRLNITQGTSAIGIQSSQSSDTINFYNNIVQDSSKSIKVGSTTINNSGLSISNTSIGSNISTSGYVSSGSTSSTNNYSRLSSNNVIINTSSSSSNSGSLTYMSNGTAKATIKYTSSSDTIDISKTINIAGNIVPTGIVYNAVYNGFGEIFRKDINSNIEYGDIVCIRPDGLVHKVSTQEDIKSIIGICSNTIGFKLGGEDIPKDEQVEVELIGQIWVKTNENTIYPGDILAAVCDGTVVKVNNFYPDKFAVALSNVVDGKVKVLYHGI